MGRIMHTFLMQKKLSTSLIILFIQQFSAEFSDCKDSNLKNICSCPERTIICQNTSLTTFNFKLEENITHINLLFNHMPILNSDFFEGSDKIGLSHLELNHNGIEYITPDVFRTLEDLEFLYLRNNYLTNLHPALFSYNLRLIVLDISNNRLVDISPGIFEYNELLSWVSVKGNPLKPHSIWSTINGTSLNVLDVDLSKKSTLIIKSLQSISHLKEINMSLSRDLSLDIFKPYIHIDLQKKYLFDENIYRNLNEYDQLFYNASEKIIYLNNNVFICYCDVSSTWFWCEKNIDKVDITYVYDLLNCTASSYEFYMTMSSSLSSTKIPDFANDKFEASSSSEMPSTFLHEENNKKENKTNAPESRNTETITWIAIGISSFLLIVAATIAAVWSGKKLCKNVGKNPQTTSQHNSNELHYMSSPITHYSMPNRSYPSISETQSINRDAESYNSDDNYKEPVQLPGSPDLNTFMKNKHKRNNNANYSLLQTHRDNSGAIRAIVSDDWYGKVPSPYHVHRVSEYTN